MKNKNNPLEGEKTESISKTELLKNRALILARLESADRFTFNLDVKDWQQQLKFIDSLLRNYPFD